jgi:hypothetical protein
MANNYSEGRGFVMLKDNTGETDDLVEYRVASYHQLHCMVLAP